MSAALQNPLSEDGSADLSEQFLNVNRDKIQRVRDCLTIRQRDLVDLVPLLFHVNDTGLPGYVPKAEPLGITGYQPIERTLAAANQLSESFQYKSHPQMNRAIKGLYLMGSPGTVGYSKNSDLDLWLVHDPGLDPKRLAQLQLKVELIESYAESLDLEMHFFVFDAEKFRSGESLSLSAESSGSSQHYLLLDEFYRSGLVLAGLKPLWWAVPANDEHRYEEFVRESCERGKLNTDDYVDFGALSRVPADEFFGAAVWQLYKSIDSPYKSVLKLLLMEAYASDYPNVDLLSHRYKKMIARGRAALNDLDPYILMYRVVEEYLIGTDDVARLELMRRCFYLKTEVPLATRSMNGIPQWQLDVLKQMTSSWTWSHADIRHLDRRDLWTLSYAASERRILIRALGKSYSALSVFARKTGDNQAITPTDLNVLGRKLYAAFERKPAKLEIITRGICASPQEAELTIYRNESAPEETAWALYTGNIGDPSRCKDKPVFEGSAPLEILAWSYFNKLLGKNTNWRIHDQKNRLPLADLSRVIDTLAETFGDYAHRAPSALSLNQRSQPLKTVLFINVGVDPLAEKFHGSVVFTSNQTDAFQFGGMRINLVRSVDLILITTWGEIFVHHYSGASAIVEAMLEYLRWGVPLGQTSLEVPEVLSLSRDHAQPIKQRVKEYAQRIIDRLTANDDGAITKYVLQIERSYFLIQVRDGVPVFERYSSQPTLVKALGRPVVASQQIAFDEGCRDVGALRAIYGANRAGVVQLFSHERHNGVDIYVTDEYGALFKRRHDNGTAQEIRSQYAKFFRRILYDNLQFGTFDNDASPEASTGYYQIIPCPHGKFMITQTAATAEDPGEFLDVRVFVDIDDSSQQQFTIFIQDEKFSTNTYGVELFSRIADYILSQRSPAQNYPLYITNLELSNRYKNHRNIHQQQTIHLLHYKMRIEHQLTRALSNQPKHNAKV